jgi:hypothetical protein
VASRAAQIWQLKAVLSGSASRKPRKKAASTSSGRRTHESTGRRAGGFEGLAICLQLPSSGQVAQPS